GLCVCIRYPNRKRGPGRTIRNKSCPSWLFSEYGTHYCHGSPKSPYYRFCFRSVVFRDRLATMATFGRVTQSYSRPGNPCQADGFWHFAGWIPTAREKPGSTPRYLVGINGQAAHTPDYRLAIGSFRISVGPGRYPDFYSACFLAYRTKCFCFCVPIQYRSRGGTRHSADHDDSCYPRNDYCCESASLEILSLLPKETLVSKTSAYQSVSQRP